MGYEQNIGKEISLFYNEELVSKGTILSMKDYVASPSGNSSIYKKSSRYKDACRGYDISYTVSNCNPNERKYNLVIIEGVMKEKANDEVAPLCNLSNLELNKLKAQILFLLLV